MIDICIPNSGQLKYSKIQIYDSVIAGAYVWKIWCWQWRRQWHRDIYRPASAGRSAVFSFPSQNTTPVPHICPKLWYRHQPGLVFSFAVIESNIDWLVMSCRILSLSAWFYRFDQSNHVSFLISVTTWVLRAHFDGLNIWTATFEIQRGCNTVWSNWAQTLKKADWLIGIELNPVHNL